MNASELTARIVQSRGIAPHGEQLELLLALGRLYGEMGVAGSGPLPALHRVCPSAAECWARVPASRRPAGIGNVDAGSEKGCIFLPWVGPRYARGGVCVLGMNLRYAGADWEFAMEHRIARDPAAGQEQALRSRHRAHRSYWATGTMRDVAAVLRSSRGETELDANDPAELGDALLCSARVQAVKCSPIGGRSSPEPAMNRNCPPRYLARELDVLGPSALLAYGRPAHAALRALGRLVVEESAGGYMRGTLKRSSGPLAFFILTHPAHGGWHAAHRLFLESLRTRPAVRAPVGGDNEGEAQQQRDAARA